MLFNKGDKLSRSALELNIDNKTSFATPTGLKKPMGGCHGQVSLKRWDFVGEVGVSLYTGDSETDFVGRNVSSLL